MGSKVVNVEVSLHEVRGDQNKLIRKFIKKCKKERIVEDYLERRYYEKPSAKRRRKKLKSRENARKAEQARSRKLKTR
jgi:ribosomal protein S21